MQHVTSLRARLAALAGMAGGGTWVALRRRRTLVPATA
jgi:hypothetical protein